jgi:hypothetical protein
MAKANIISHLSRWLFLCVLLGKSLAAWGYRRHLKSLEMPKDKDRIQFSLLATAADLCLCAIRIRLRNR